MPCYTRTSVVFVSMYKYTSPARFALLPPVVCVIDTSRHTHSQPHSGLLVFSNIFISLYQRQAEANNAILYSYTTTRTATKERASQGHPTGRSKQRYSNNGNGSSNNTKTNTD